MTTTEIKDVLAEHEKWLQCNGGTEADLYGADLAGANLAESNLIRANLYGANLSEADLSEANLIRANLTRSNLSEANLTRADLYGADLSEVDLSGADLSGSDLSEANLIRAYLSGADLSEANLIRANLSGADLDGTCLDPNASPNAEVGDYKIEGGYAIGYRTRRAGHIDIYRDGRFYSADVFSVSDTECHPGLYLWPTLKMATDWASRREIIRVRTRPSEIHRAGGKWRCRWFEVLGRQEI